MSISDGATPRVPLDASAPPQDTLSAPIPRRAVVLCADDYGISDGVSRGILELLEASRLSATSVMVNGLAGPDAFSALALLAGRVGIGLHLNLTAGAPLGAAKGLAPSGRLPPLRALAVGALTGCLPLDEIRAELARQLDRFGTLFGRMPDFVDGHQHVHVLPGIRRVLLEHLAEHGFAGWVRDPTDHPRAILARPEPVKGGAVTLSASGFATACRRAGLRTNAGFSGFSAFAERTDLDAAFRGYFRALGPAPVVMCHPGYPDGALAAIDPVGAPRAAERAYLASEAFADRLRADGVHLVAEPLSRVGEGQG